MFLPWGDRGGLPGVKGAQSQRQAGTPHHFLASVSPSVEWLCPSLLHDGWWGALKESPEAAQESWIAEGLRGEGGWAWLRTGAGPGGGVARLRLSLAGAGPRGGAVASLGGGTFRGRGLSGGGLRPHSRRRRG